MIADAPRQVINGLILSVPPLARSVTAGRLTDLTRPPGASYSFGTVFRWQTTDLTAYYGGNIVTLLLLLAMIFTIVVFVVNFVLLVVAAVLYLPLLCHIKGNLKVCRRCLYPSSRQLTDTYALFSVAGVLLPQGRQGEARRVTQRLSNSN